MKISDYTGTTSLASGDLFLVATSGSSNHSIKTADILGSYSGWPILTISGSGVRNTMVNLSGGFLNMPVFNGADDGVQGRRKILFLDYSGNPQGTELAYIGCWGDHGGQAHTCEFQFASSRSIGIIPGYNGAKDAFVQLGNSSPNHERWYLQSDTSHDAQYDSYGITNPPYGHSKRLAFSCLASGGLYCYPGLIGASVSTNLLEDTTHPDSSISGELWFYSVLPGYDGASFTTHPGSRVGKMLINGWELRGKQLREISNPISISTVTVDFNKARAQVFDIITANVTVSTTNTPTGVVAFQEVDVILRAPISSALTFPAWVWGSPTGIISAPTGITSGQALNIRLKSIGSGDANILAEYSTYSLPFSYDTDAASFISTANVTGTIQKLAVNNLVLSAKAHNWWSRCDVIYPFVGGTSGTHSYNLKNPAQFRITWNGALTGVGAHTASGISGDGSSAYGNSNFTPSTDGVNLTSGSTHAFGYASYLNPTNGADMFGVLAGGKRIGLNKGNDIYWYALGINNGQTVEVGIDTSPDFRGPVLATRTALDTEGIYTLSGGSVAAGGTVAAGLPVSPIYIAARNDNGSPGHYFSGAIQGISLGAGMTATDWTNLKEDWNNFQTILGRKTP